MAPPAPPVNPHGKKKKIRLKRFPVQVSGAKRFDGLTRYVPIVKKVIPSIDNINTGLLLYNFPLNVFKNFMCTIAAAFIYPITNNVANGD